MNETPNEIIMKLSPKERQIYARMINRNDLTDMEDGVVCFTVSITVIAKGLGITNATALKYMRALEAYGLLKRETPKKFGPSTYYVANKLNYFPIHKRN